MEEEKQEHLRHSLAHLLAAAVLDLWPDTKQAIGPAIENGFYYDFDFNAESLDKTRDRQTRNPSIKLGAGERGTVISENDLAKIEKRMREILPTWKEFKGIEVSAEEAKKTFKDNPYKLELIEELEKGDEKITLYTSGSYTDLCRGGHIDDPQEINADTFKLMSIAGAYWRGSEKNPMLTRIYGAAFNTKKELDEYLINIEEAKKRDHRELGKKLKLFTFNDLVGSGLPLWLPKGTILKDEIEKFAIETENKAGYVRVSTPHLAKEELFKKSGHLPYYAESMFPPMQMDDGNYYLKAMNCPLTHMIYKSEPRSYRDLPIRLAEYGTVYRNELSGTLAGLLRARMLSMNDAHIYCREDQIESEFKKVIEMINYYSKVFNIESFWFRLSKWDPAHKEKYIDEPENWEYSERVLEKVLEDLKVKYVEAKDEAAFYGPKVDVQFKSVSGREETMSTVQLDFSAKKSFDLTYKDKDGQNKEVFVIHRAPLSTHERFIAFLIEHFAGAFPVWLSPVQVKVLSIAERHAEQTRKIAKSLREAALRVEVGDRNDTINKKIRDAELQKIPYLLIVGDKETESDKVAVRTRGKGDIGQMNLDDFIKQIKEEIESRTI